MESKQDDVFEFCLDQLDLTSENDSPLYPALSDPTPLSSELLDDAGFEQFDDALIPIDESGSIASLPKSSPSQIQRKPAPRSEALAASLNLDANKLRAMQTVLNHDLHPDINSARPKWFDDLPGLPGLPYAGDSISAMSDADINDEEWGGAPFTVPIRHHRTKFDPRAASEPSDKTKNQKLAGPIFASFRPGFGPGLKLVCHGATSTSIRVLRLEHQGVNVKLVEHHQKAVDRGEPLQDLAHSYKEFPGDHWALLIALFDPGYNSCYVHMRNALSNWFESALASEGDMLISGEIRQHIVVQDRKIPGSDFWTEIASSLLGHRLADAIDVSIRHGNLRLATLIAENGSGLRGQSRPLLREQIKKWILSGTWQTFTETCQIVYRILAGDVADEGSDWLSNLSAKFWFNDRPDESLLPLLTPFKSSAYDIRRSLLDFRADPSMPTARLFRGNPKRFDFALMWHIYDILTRRNVILYGTAAWSLRVCYAAQLEASKQLKSALYIIIIGSRHDPVATKSLLQDILTRNWPKSVESNFARVQFGVPELSNSRSTSELSNFTSTFNSTEESDLIDFVTYWADKAQVGDAYDPVVLLYTAKYARCMSDGNMTAAMTCAMRASLWESAYSLFVVEIVFHLILTEDFAACNRLMSQFAVKQEYFPQTWNTSGEALFRLIAFAECREPDCERAHSGFLTSIRRGAKSEDAIKKLTLLECAVQCAARAKAVQRARLTRLLQ